MVKVRSLRTKIETQPLESSMYETCNRALKMGMLLIEIQGRCQGPHNQHICLLPGRMRAAVISRPSMRSQMAVQRLPTPMSRLTNCAEATSIHLELWKPLECTAWLWRGVSSEQSAMHVTRLAKEMCGLAPS